MSARWLACILAVSILAAPAAAATWGAKGSFEPDTLADLSGGFMFPDADQSPDLTHRRVYFNGFFGQLGGVGAGLTTSVNPNFAASETSVQPVPANAYAILGVWKDCNHDGYMGYGDNALWEYRVELLPADHVCAARTTDPHDVGYIPQHNDGTWVRELLPISWDNVATSANENPYNFNDTNARVWADYGAPGAQTRGTCLFLPQARGTFQSTGGMMRWLDCYSGHRGAAAISLAAHEAGAHELAFDDAPAHRPDQSASTLNRPNPWGRPDDEAVVTAFDCSQPPVPYAVSDPTDPGNGRGALHEVVVPGVTTVRLTNDRGHFLNGSQRPPSASAPNPEGSPSGTMNETWEGSAGDCDRDDNEPSNALETLPYAAEGGAEPVSPEGRSRSDFVLFSREESRQPSALTDLLGRGTPQEDFGVAFARTTGFWESLTTTPLSRTPYLDRETLGAERVTFVTFYAYTSKGVLVANGLLAPSATPGAYGAEACNQAPSPFVCDSSRWWKDATGADINPDAPGLPGQKAGVTVGQPYRFRDIDCIDTSAAALRDANVQWGAVSGTACGRP